MIQPCNSTDIVLESIKRLIIFCDSHLETLCHSCYLFYSRQRQDSCTMDSAPATAPGTVRAGTPRAVSTKKSF